MNLELEERVASLERDVRFLKELVATNGGSKKDWESTVGMFADDPEFAEIVRLGREYREQERARELQ